MAYPVVETKDRFYADSGLTIEVPEAMVEPHIEKLNKYDAWREHIYNLEMTSFEKPTKKQESIFETFNRLTNKLFGH